MRIVLIALVGLLCNLGLAQEKALFNRATDLYNDGKFEEALDYYQRILDNNKHSAELYFNMGNANYKLENIGPSIYYYEKALLLKPNDAEILNNLGYAQNMRLDAIEEMPKTALQNVYNKIVGFFNFEQWGYLAIGLMTLFVLTYVLYYLLFTAFNKRLFFIFSILFLLLSMASLSMAYFAYNDYKKNNPAIIFAREVVVAAEPNEQSERVFTLHEGTKINVVEALEDWSKIRIADGQIGWIPSDSFKALKDF
ncbi:BatE protein [Croceivirga lutea]|uniref:tetratricopeptide repeat protein n=1 Tax=Croceivirga lutea TaxID=1775167 RepID=UPI00163960D5|nr:tetratricopeptide repeat protein [Croceivirga lutea]GGG37994.1 BatE protein [Croceivirga lutea]